MFSQKLNVFLINRINVHLETILSVVSFMFYIIIHNLFRKNKQVFVTNNKLKI